MRSRCYKISSAHSVFPSLPSLSFSFSDYFVGGKEILFSSLSPLFLSLGFALGWIKVIFGIENCDEFNQIERHKKGIQIIFLFRERVADTSGRLRFEKEVSNGSHKRRCFRTDDLSVEMEILRLPSSTLLIESFSNLRDSFSFYS